MWVNQRYFEKQEVDGFVELNVQLPATYQNRIIELLARRIPELLILLLHGTSHSLLGRFPYVFFFCWPQTKIN